MRNFKMTVAALGAALLVAACGGGGGGNQTPPIAYSKVVSFGDSLSDAGTYNVGAVKAAGGGLFTVNGVVGAIGADPVPSYTWAQVLAASVTGQPSCAARVGGFSVLETKNPGAPASGCWNYAQGGARVLNSNGYGNVEGGNLGVIALPALPVGQARVGALTEPVQTQIANYIADGGGFANNELVTVMAGANDIYAALNKLTADATAQGNNDFPVELGKLLAAGITPTPTGAAMGTAVVSIATAFGQGFQVNQSVNEGVLAAVHAAVLLGNSSVLDGAVVIATAQADATNPAKVIAVMQAAAAATPPVILTQTQAGGQVFVTSLTTQLVADIPAAQKAAAAAAIPTAFNTAYGAALSGGSSATAAQNAAVGAALQAAADGGNAKVSAILGTSNHSTLGAVGNATLAANQFALAWATANGQTDIGPMVVQAANDLVAIVKDLVNNKKATRIVILNIPDMSLTPDAKTQSAATQQLILGLVQAFNGTLQAGLNVTPGVPSNGVLLVDYFTNMQSLINDPGHYALAIDPVTQKALTTPVCQEVVPLNIGLNNGSSLMCNAGKTGSTIAGDTTHYMFADGVHPTPFAHKLAAQFINKLMIQAGWL